MRITELHAKLVEVAGTFKCAVYSDTNGLANHLLRSSVEALNVTNGWNTFALTSPLDLSAGEYYWLVIWSDTAEARIQYDSTGSASWGSYFYFDLGGEWPDPINLTDGQAARTYCLYAEGTPIGTVAGATINLRGNGKLIVSSDATPSVLDGTDFGSLGVGGGTRDQTFTIQNPGDAPLQLTGNPPVALSGPHAGDFSVTTPPAATVAPGGINRNNGSAPLHLNSSRQVVISGPQAGDFSVTTQPATPIQPGGTSSFTVRFAPAASGARQATLSIENDSDRNPFDFAIRGTGTAMAMRIIEIKPDSASGSVILQWSGDGPQFQVEKATTVQGAFQPLGAPQSGRIFTDPEALRTNAQSFYRVRQISP